MIVIIIYLVLLFLSKIIKNKKIKRFRKKILTSPLVLLALGMITAVCIDMAGYQDGYWYDQFITFSAIMMFAWPIKLVVCAVNKRNKAPLELEGDEDKLPSSAIGRRKIVERFNEKYELRLTDAQIESIVNGSFQSNMWKDEIVAMNKKYDSISEWYASDTNWLRAYMKVFNVQNISTDFEFQKDICIRNFNEIFSSIDATKYNSVEEWIKKCDAMFLTNFDESCYMIAHRFLEVNGYGYALPNMNIIKVSDELDGLIDKYDKTSTGITAKMSS